MLPIQPTTCPATNPLTFAIEHSLALAINKENRDSTRDPCFQEFPDKPVELIGGYVGDYSLIPPERFDQLVRVITTASDMSIPGVLAKIIAEYSCSDFAVALQDFPIDGRNTVTNRKIYEDIRNARLEALISHECDAVIKRIIFFKARYTEEREILKGIIKEIRRKDYQLILDGADLSGFDLCGFDFSGMSAINANFSGTLMRNTILRNVDFTGAHIQGSWIINSTMAQSILVSARIDGSFFNVVDLSGADCCDLVSVKPTRFCKVNGFELITNNSYMKAFFGHIGNTNGFHTLLKHVELTVVFSTESGVDFKATESLIKEVNELDKSNVARADSTCTVS